jgi:uncharacterized LabA/DUF88 family protein/cold shock CspA family protein
MLKAGIFLDDSNLSRCGGWGMNLRQVREIAEAQDMTVVRANTYLAVDTERERRPDQKEYTEKVRRYRYALRREGFHIVTKEVSRYTDEEGNTVIKANADVDLTVDALLQSEQLDYVLLGTGDGDFIRLVRALQNRGKRVDLLAFSNVSGELRREVDFYYDGYLVPGLLEVPERSYRGYLHKVYEQKNFGFVTYRTGFRPTDVCTDVFLHRSNVEEGALSSEQFERLERMQDRAPHIYIEFDIQEGKEGRPEAYNVVTFDPLT